MANGGLVGRTPRGFFLWSMLVLASCSAGRHYHTDAETFIELAGAGPESLRSCTLVGAADGRAYLRVWSNLPGWLGGGDHIYSVSLDALPRELAEQIVAGRDPRAR